MAEQQTRPTGASPGPTPTRRPWWGWALIAVVIIVLLVLWLVRCGSGSDSGSDSDQAATGGSVVPSAAPAAGSGTAPSAAAVPPAADASAGAPASSSAPSASSSGGANGAAGAGTLTAGDSALLPLSGVAGPNGELTALVGRAVTARSVPVESVPADEGFWVGPSGTDRVWVELTVPPGESPYQVRPGQLVDFTGPMTGQDGGYAGQAGVDAAEGADQLTREAAHVAVQKADLRIARG
jgi:hypothetical protein